MGSNNASATTLVEIRGHGASRSIVFEPNTTRPNQFFHWCPEGRLGERPKERERESAYGKPTGNRAVASQPHRIDRPTSSCCFPLDDEATGTLPHPPSISLSLWAVVSWSAMAGGWDKVPPLHSTRQLNPRPPSLLLLLSRFSTPNSHFLFSLESTK